MASLSFFQAEDGIRDLTVTGVQTCALPICARRSRGARRDRRRGALRGEPDPRPRGAPRLSRARRALHARRVHPDGDSRGVARRRAARGTVPPRDTPPPPPPRRAPPPALPSPRAPPA